MTRPVQATDPDLTVSTVNWVGTDDLAGLEDPITASATNSVNLFQPSAKLTATASPTAGAVGTPVTYTFTVTNTSSSNSPNLVLDLNNPNDSFTSALFGNIEADAIHAFTGSNLNFLLPHRRAERMGGRDGMRTFFLLRPFGKTGRGLVSPARFVECRWRVDSIIPEGSTRFAGCPLSSCHCH